MELFTKRTSSMELFTKRTSSMELFTKRTSSMELFTNRTSRNVLTQVVKLCVYKILKAWREP